MKFKLPKPDTMDKAVLVVAVLGVIVAFLTIRHVPQPVDNLPALEKLEQVTELQSFISQAIDHSDWVSACKAQQHSVDLQLQNNFPEEIVDSAIELERMICERANQNLL